MFSAVVSLGAAGCGGGDDSEDPAPAPVETTTTDSATTDLTKDELIAEGDDICAEVNSAVGTIDASTTADPSIAESQIADIYSGMADRLEELGTPTDGDAPTDVIDAAQALADSGSTDGATALSDLQTAATEYGFEECGDAPAAPSSTGDPSSSGTDPSTVPADPGYVPPTTAPAPTAPVPTAPPSTGGGVAPAPEPSPGGGSGSSTGGGISPG